MNREKKPWAALAIVCLLAGGVLLNGPPGWQRVLGIIGVGIYLGILIWKF